MRDRWLPEGYELADGKKIQSLLFGGDEWQIYSMEGAANVLLARPVIAQKWWNLGFLNESLFEETLFHQDRYFSFRSDDRYALAPVYCEIPPNDKADALAFAIALKRSRSLVDWCSFHDAVYVEQFSRLLPVWTSARQITDDWVLGTWLTGGIATSTDSLEILGIRMGWGSPVELAAIVEAAGLPLPVNAPTLTPQRPQWSHHAVASTSANMKEQPTSVEAEVQSRTFSLPGRPQLEEFFNDHVIDIIFNGDKYRAFGIEFPSPIILHGPPGSGKTFAVDQLVEFLGLPLYEIDSGSIGSKYIHETSKLIAETFERAIRAAPAVIVIDEVEAFLSDRRRDAEGHRVEEVAEFLRRIPEASANKVLVMAMTNMIDMLDPAILRRGRFDHIIEVLMPSRVEVASALDSLLTEFPTGDNIDLNPLLDVLTGKPLADAAFVVREAARLTAKADQTVLEQENLVVALASLQADSKLGPAHQSSSLFAL